MRKLELDTLLVKSVADALGVPLPDAPPRQAPAKLPRHVLPKRARALAAHPRNHHRAVQHV